MSRVTRATRRRGAALAMSRLVATGAALALGAFAAGCGAAGWVRWLIVAAWVAVVPLPGVLGVLVRLVRLIRSVDGQEIRAASEIGGGR